MSIVNKAVFISKRGMFDRNNNALVDMITGHMAMDIEVAIKTSAGTPVKTGAMKSDVRHFKAANRTYRVEADKAYAAPQELGRRAGAAPFKNYTTHGTSAGWFKRSINKVVDRKENYAKEARRALNL